MIPVRDTTMKNQLPEYVPTGMQDYVHAYFGLWAMADNHFDAMLAMARTFDLRSHVTRLAPVAVTADGEPEDDECDDEPCEDDMEAKRKKQQCQALMAALPGLEPAGAFDGYITADGIAVIELRGTLMKFCSSFCGGTSTTRARRAIREAVADGRVRGIMLLVDSPGGTVAGTAELADDISEANQKKPVWAYAEDFMASAAYWVSSQCARIGANRTALVGSLGTLMGMYDYSAAFKDAGIEPKVYRTGKRKGAGFIGTKFTADDDEYFQSLAVECNSHFQTAVGIGRPRADIEALFADAGVYIASEAKSKRLVDDICAVEDFYRSLVKSVAKASSASTRAQTEEQPVSAQDDTTPVNDTVVSTPAVAGEMESSMDTSKNGTGATQPGATGGALPATAATIVQLKAAFPKAGNDFFVAQLEQNATLDQARAAYVALLETENEKLHAKLKEAPAAAASAATPAAPATAAAATPALPATTASVTPAPKPGAEAVPTRRSESTDNADISAAAELDRKAKAYMEGRPSVTIAAARQRVLATDNNLRARYIQEAGEQSEQVKKDRLAALAGLAAG